LVPLAEKSLDPADLMSDFRTPAGLKEDHHLQGIVDDELDKKAKAVSQKVAKALKGTRFALIDLTGGAPKVAGNKAHGEFDELRAEQAFGGSMIKLAAMYAAYQLQYDLNVLAKNHKPALATKEQLYQAAWDNWVSTQKLDPHAKAVALGHVLKEQGRLVKDSKGTRFRLRYPEKSWNNITTWEQKHPHDHNAKFEFIDGAPNLDSIFEFIAPTLPGKGKGTPAKVQFKHNAHPLDEDFLIADNDLDSLVNTPFYDRMLLMIDQSNNAAAATCIMDLGYLYIASSLLQSGLFSPAHGGGLWLSAPYHPLPAGARGKHESAQDYNKRVNYFKKWIPHFKLWVPNPLPSHRPGNQRNFQVTSPAAIAMFMALLAQNKLVSPHASSEMKQIMNLNKDPAYGSGDRRLILPNYIAQFLDTDRGSHDLYDLAEIESKIGIGDDTIDDCAIIKRTIGHKTFRYVWTFVDLLFTDANDVLPILPRLLDQCIQRNNP
jgi:hypothetical protein